MYQDMVSSHTRHPLGSNYNNHFFKQTVPCDPVAGADWQLGNIPFERLYLLELRQVTGGTWQPVLSLL